MFVGVGLIHCVVCVLLFELFHDFCMCWLLCEAVLKRFSNCFDLMISMLFRVLYVKLYEYIYIYMYVNITYCSNLV